MLRTRVMPLPRLRPARRLARFRHRLPDGRLTTVHVARHRRDRTALRVALLPEPTPLAAWCAAYGVRDALVGGFFVTGADVALGELWVAGERRPSVPFTEPWDGQRACVAVEGARVRIDGRDALTPAAGDLLQAGPRLVRAGVPLVTDGVDPEGFSAGRAQFDSDIADGRHPRAALGVTPDELIAVACDGRAPREAGLSLGELARLLARLGAEDAINLDGGGSTALVARGRLRNTPRSAWRTELPGGRPIVTALVFAPRRP